MEMIDADKMNIVTIGYHDANAVYLLPHETWHELQKYCIQEGSNFPLSKSTFFKMLKDKGLLASSNDGQPTVQKKIRGKNHRMLKLIGGGIYEYFVTSVTDDINN
jgi:hypothetical protein